MNTTALLDLLIAEKHLLSEMGMLVREKESKDKEIKDLKTALNSLCGSKAFITKPTFSINYDYTKERIHELRREVAKLDVKIEQFKDELRRTRSDIYYYFKDMEE